MGAFPIQANTADTSGWIEQGVNGYVAPPEDPSPVAELIASALNNDEMVDRAAEMNLDLLRSRKEIEQVRPRLVEELREILQSASAEA